MRIFVYMLTTMTDEQINLTNDQAHRLANIMTNIVRLKRRAKYLQRVYTLNLLSIIINITTIFFLVWKLMK